MRPRLPRRVGLRAPTLLALLLPLLVASPWPPPPARATSLPDPLASAAPPPVTGWLNGGNLLANVHGLLFHESDADIQEDLAYVHWLGAGVVRVFATDTNSARPWSGSRVGSRIADIAPALRDAHVRLIVALVNNHQPVPGERPGSAGWLDGYRQLLLPFYVDTWHQAYLTFARDLIGTVRARGAADVVFAWELGNELHTPQQPQEIVPFVSQAAAEIRALDPTTPILPGTMGANHVQPWRPDSPIARWLYCDAPVDAYTLHAYDWLDRQRPGDMPIDWDLDVVTPAPCPSGRRLPVLVEELGTSRALPGVYDAGDESGRLAQELRQLRLVQAYRLVVGVGAWNAESPRLLDRTSYDSRRGLTSYGAAAQGGGSCYDPFPDPQPAVRCQLEQVLHSLSLASAQSFSTGWQAAPGADPLGAVVGGLDPPSLSLDAQGQATVEVSGWAADGADPPAPLAGLDLYLGAPGTGAPLASAQLGLPRRDLLAYGLDGAWGTTGFQARVPGAALAGSPATLTLVARTAAGGTFTTSLPVAALPAPTAAGVAPPATPLPTAVARVAPRAARGPFVEVLAPAPNATVSRGTSVDGLAFDPRAGESAGGIDRVEVFLDPDRDAGGQALGAAALGDPVSHPTATWGTVNATPFHLVASLPAGARTLYVHVRARLDGREAVLALPVVAG